MVHAILKRFPPVFFLHPAVITLRAAKAASRTCTIHCHPRGNGNGICCNKVDGDQRDEGASLTAEHLFDSQDGGICHDVFWFFFSFI